MKQSFWQSDWFLGLVTTGLIFAVSETAIMESMEKRLYDWALQSTQADPPSNIAVIAIDDTSIDNLGRWPWSREIHAEMIQHLAKGQPKAIYYGVFFSEPQKDRGLKQIELIADFLDKSAIATRLPEDVRTLSNLLQRPVPVSTITQPQTGTVRLGLGGNTAAAPAPTQDRSQQLLLNQAAQFLATSSIAGKATEEVHTLRRMLAEASKKMNTDQELGDAIAKAGNVILPMMFILGEPRGNLKALPDFVAKNAIANVLQPPGGEERLGLHSERAIFPIAEVAKNAYAIGHLSSFLDADGGNRAIPLAIKYEDHYYPSVAVLAAARAMNVDPDGIYLRVGKGVGVETLQIKTDDNFLMNSFFYSDKDGKSAFEEDSFFDVYTKKIPVEKYKDKVVLIGTTAAAIGERQVTPISPSMAPVVTLAHITAGILNEDFYQVPDWAGQARWGAFGFSSLFLMLVLPFLRAGWGMILSLILVGGLVASHFYFMMTMRLWVPFATPIALLGSGYLAVTVRRFRSTEAGKIQTDAESAESNRMLGLAFQGQGQLDMAFEKFRKCPLDDGMMEVLYNLALDFERKRQFSKAIMVYKHMEEYDDAFRDIKKRMERADKLENTVVLGGGTVSSGSVGGTLINPAGSGDIEKPRLGRYEIEKELGKGAMGIVYLGKDPKINRVVAIKTLNLSQEFSEEDLKEVRERFFREAETAGRLNHPNIVTMYDIGEEHDLCYIAMEFLTGKDLTSFTKPDVLLPLPALVNIVARVAMALDYAHQNNVVHRDIKPANIMYDPKAKAIKITDFGIARLTDSSKTKTGMVLGTPSYMSPEQLSGKKVDGRSDLWSLGVMFYQMVCGHLPFKAAAMATLMYKISQEDAPDILTYRPDLPPCIAEIIRMAMKKDPDQRYQKGSEMARDLVKCAKSQLTN